MLITRWQWNKAKEAIAETENGRKAKAGLGVAMKMKFETVESYVDFCLRAENIQDVAYVTRAIKNEAQPSAVPNASGKTIEQK